ncbi:MAG: VCBS repeat-containing protein [Phycisphaerales bacterium]
MNPQINSLRCVLAIAGLVCAATVTDVLTAQWVSFADDTAFRLLFDAFVDDPAGDPLSDDQEKDIAVGDLNMDGWDDVVIVRKQPFSSPGARQDILLMNEGGDLVDRTAELAPGFIADLTDARDVLIGDFTNDGWPDVVIADTFVQQPKFYRNLGEDGRGNWLGLADESTDRFPVIEVANMAGPKFCAVSGGDVNGDNAPDIFFSNYNPQFGVGTTDVLLINDGAGNFTDESAARLGQYAAVAFGTAAQIRDMDNDGDNDIVKISTLYAAPPFDSRWLGILYNDGNGVFHTLPAQEFPNFQPYMFDIADLNGDGMLDLFHEGDNQDRILLVTSITPDSNITFNVTMPDPSPRTAGFGGNTKIADIDNDGDLDVGVAPIDVDIQNCGEGNEFALLRNDSAGAFDDPWPTNDDQNFHLDAHDFAFIDVNNDGCQDLLLGLCTGWRVLIQEGCESSCPWDIDGTGSVGAADLLALLFDWGPCKGCAADFDDDGIVGASDLLAMLFNWGPCP